MNPRQISAPIDLFSKKEFINLDGKKILCI